MKMVNYLMPTSGVIVHQLLRARLMLENPERLKPINKKTGGRANRMNRIPSLPLMNGIRANLP